MNVMEVVQAEYEDAPDPTHGELGRLDRQTDHCYLSPVI